MRTQRPHFVDAGTLSLSASKANVNEHGSDVVNNEINLKQPRRVQGLATRGKMRRALTPGRAIKRDKRCPDQHHEG